MLYGDGAHDDAPAIQAMLDGGAAAVRLPTPQVCYLIGSPLRIHSRQQLTLDRFCHIRLKEGASCRMLENADPENGDTDIAVDGGIWDMNNVGQAKNPLLYPDPALPDYLGIAVFFTHVTRLRLTNLTVKDPVTFAITLDTVRGFTVENIDFDFNHGNPSAVNMDGVHLNGNCRFGVIRNLKGTCYDDMVALNADEGSAGPITDIEIDGLFAEGCHSAVRLLACAQRVEDIHISNVFGTYYQYCVGLTKYYDYSPDGWFDGIVLSDIHASKAPRRPFHCKDGMMVFPLIWAESGCTVKNLHIRDVYRKEESVAIETIGIDAGARVGEMHVENVVSDNRLPEPCPVIRNCGSIGCLRTSGIRCGDDEPICGGGTILTHLHD